jgi:hypothetical protein
MLLVPSASPQSAVPRASCRLSGLTRAASAGKSLLIYRLPCRTDLTGGPTNAATGLRRRASGQVGSCIFLLIPRRVRPDRAVHRFAGGDVAASHKSLVNSKENTSARRPVGSRQEAGTHWQAYENRSQTTACGATRRPNINAEGHRRRPPPIVGRCRSLLISSAGAGTCA